MQPGTHHLKQLWSLGQFKSGPGTSEYNFSLLYVVGNCSWEGGRKDHFNLVLLLSKAAEMKCGISAEVVKQSLAMCVTSTLIEDYCTHE